MAVTFAKRPFWVNRVLRARRATVVMREVYEMLEELMDVKSRKAEFSIRELADKVRHDQKAVISSLRKLSSWDGDSPPVIAYIPSVSPKERSIAVLYLNEHEEQRAEEILTRSPDQRFDSGDPEFEKFWRYYPWEARGDKRETFEVWEKVRRRVDYKDIEGELFRARAYEQTPYITSAAEWLLTTFGEDE